MPLGQNRVLPRLSISKRLFSPNLIFELVFKQSVVLLHEPILVVHDIISCRVHAGHRLLFSLTLQNLLVNSLLSRLAGNPLLVVFKRYIVKPLSLLHESQLLPVAIADVSR